MIRKLPASPFTAADILFSLESGAQAVMAVTNSARAATNILQCVILFHLLGWVTNPVTNKSPGLTLLPLQLYRNNIFRH